jgi:hypothetical protein
MSADTHVRQHWLALLHALPLHTAPDAIARLLPRVDDADARAHATPAMTWRQRDWLERWPALLQRCVGAEIVHDTHRPIDVRDVDVDRVLAVMATYVALTTRVVCSSLLTDVANNNDITSTLTTTTTTCPTRAFSRRHTS